MEGSIYIESDGTPYGTFVLTKKDGDRIRGVSGFSIKYNPDLRATVASLEFCPVAISMLTKVEQESLAAVLRGLLGPDWLVCPAEPYIPSFELC